MGGQPCTPAADLQAPLLSLPSPPIPWSRLALNWLFPGARMEFHCILSITESHEPQKQQSRPVSCSADGNLHLKGMVGGASTCTLREGLPSWRGGHTEAAAEATEQE